MSPERELRRVLVRLAALHPEDTAAILERLQEADRRLVENLLSRRLNFQALIAPLAELPFDATRFSPWLLARMHSHEGTMTAKAREKLIACAERLYPAVKAPPPSPAGSAWFDRMRERVTDWWRS